MLNIKNLFKMWLNSVDVSFNGEIAFIFLDIKNLI